jgi:hypothetical protein
MMLDSGRRRKDGWHSDPVGHYIDPSDWIQEVSAFLHVYRSPIPLIHREPDKNGKWGDGCIEPNLPVFSNFRGCFARIFIAWIARSLRLQYQQVS